MKTEKVRASIKALKEYQAQNNLMDDEPITRLKMCAICCFSENTLTKLKRSGVLKTEGSGHYKKRYRLKDVIDQFEALLVGPTLEPPAAATVGALVSHPTNIDHVGAPGGRRSGSQEALLMTVRANALDAYKDTFIDAAEKAKAMGDSDAELHLLREFSLKEEELRKVIMT